jgi:hypothetical protein
MNPIALVRGDGPDSMLQVPIRSDRRLSTEAFFEKGRPDENKSLWVHSRPPNGTALLKPG